MDGPTGFSGSAGPKGFAGATGPPGPVGWFGPRGNTGFTGAKGTSHCLLPTLTCKHGGTKSKPQKEC